MQCHQLHTQKKACFNFRPMIYAVSSSAYADGSLFQLQADNLCSVVIYVHTLKWERLS